MPIIQVIPDRFKQVEKTQLASITRGASTDQNHIRRPVRGIAIKEDTFATLRVVAGNGKTVPIIDAGSRRKDAGTNRIFEVDGKRATDVYSNFLIQNVNEERAEKHQILETFGEPFVFFFGERARMITFSGILLNTFDFNWEAEWWHNYDNFLRGTRCVENDARVFLSFDETLVTGYITMAAASKNAQDKNFVNFQFGMFVTGYTNFSKIGNPNALPGLDDSQVGTEESFSAAELAPFRPSIIDTDTSLSATMQLQSGALADVSLFEGLANGLNQASQAFNSLRNQAESVVKRLSDLANGTIIRVPLGFAGAMEFDGDVDPATLQEVTGAGVVKYSTFDQNEDEYVGSSDHYGSAVRDSGANRILDDNTVVLTRNAEMQTAAEAIWAKNGGFQVPSVDDALVAEVMVRGAFGMIAVGSNEAWKASSPPEDPEDAFPTSTIRATNTSSSVEE